jgi:Lipocalin-like domain
MKINSQIVGTWNLQSFSELDVHTKAASYPMGEKPKATVIYTADGYVATIFAAAVRVAPAGPRPTDSEAIQLFRTMVAFAGRYEGQ